MEVLSPQHLQCVPGGRRPQLAQEPTEGVQISGVACDGWERLGSPRQKHPVVSARGSGNELRLERLANCWLEVEVERYEPNERVAKGVTRTEQVQHFELDERACTHLARDASHAASGRCECLPAGDLVVRERGQADLFTHPGECARDLVKPWSTRDEPPSSATSVLLPLTARLRCSFGERRASDALGGCEATRDQRH